MSLTFSDQHLAWQQRVGKEVTTASKVLEVFTQFPNYRKSRRSNSSSLRNHSSGSKELKPKHEDLSQVLQRTFMQSNLGVYSEVRGKYARPAPQLNQSKQNPVLNRPTTAGSLRPRTNKLLSGEKLLETKEDEEIVKRPKSSLDFSMKSVSSRRSKRSRKSVSRSEIVKSDEKIDAKQLVNAAQNEIKLEELLDQVKFPQVKKHEFVKFAEPIDSATVLAPAPPPAPEPPLSPTSEDPVPSAPPSLQDNISNSLTYKTTSSHRRYISELEQLLFQEQQKRQQLEQLLHSLISNNLK